MADMHPAEQNLDGLVAAIQQTHAVLLERAGQAVNLSLTLRNWFIGCYIAEFEQSGADRADYGARLLESLSGRLLAAGMGGVAARSLRQYRQFYLTYPQMWQTPTARTLQSLLPDALLVNMRQTLSAKSSAGAEFAAVPSDLLARLSFSHFAELIAIEDPLQRSFYELETLRGHWSVRELKRQIATQYYQRSDLSTDKPSLARLTQEQALARRSPGAAHQIIRDPYVFEFLGLKPHEAVTEGQLEDALLELKNDAFQHEHLGQLNAYVSYYSQHEMSSGDAPPIGILLCTAKNHELVEFALAGITNQLFVSRYQVQLPDKAKMQAFLQQALSELGAGMTDDGNR